MKNFNKILALGLVGASALTGGFMLSGCDATTNNNTTQTEQNQDEQKAVSSISLNADTLPNYIIKGHFARTNITMTVTYEDGSTKVVDVTESMFNETDKEKLNNVGQYNLTVNYGDKTATMYANVVDERYLLKEVVEANLDKDVTITTDDGTVSQRDVENKILYCNSNDDYISWMWLNNNICYNYEVEDGNDGVNKGLVSDFDDIANNTYEYLVLDMLNGVDEDGDTWTIDSIEKDGLNYILTATAEDKDVEGVVYTHKYYFNEDFMYKVESIQTEGSSIYDETSYNFNYSIVNLEVPAEIKALESSATIHLASRIDDLRSVMEDYLESDFEMYVNGESYAKYDADTQISCTTEDGNRVWMWLNGDYCYTHYNGDPQLNKHDSFAWEGRLKGYLFTEDVLNESVFEYSATVSADGQYYELTIATNDEEDAVYKYIFNDNEIAKIEVSYNGSVDVIATYVKKSIILQVPTEIKALESSAQ